MRKMEELPPRHTRGPRQVRLRFALWAPCSASSFTSSLTAPLRSFPVTNPSTGEVFAVAPHADAAMCDDAVESAVAAGPAWAATPIEERRAKMTEAMEILKVRRATRVVDGGASV